MIHPNEPTYDELLKIRDELRTEQNVDIRKLKTIEVQIKRHESAEVE